MTPGNASRIERTMSRYVACVARRSINEREREREDGKRALAKQSIIQETFESDGIEAALSLAESRFPRSVSREEEGRGGGKRRRRRLKRRADGRKETEGEQRKDEREESAWDRLL